MKKSTFCIVYILLLSALLFLGCNAVYNEPEADVPTGQNSEAADNAPPIEDVEAAPPQTALNGTVLEVDEKRDFRAVWVTTVFNLDFPSRQNLYADALKWEINNIVERTAELGLNAIIFQVRPTGDAFYESDIFPWSHWLSGVQGQGIPGFDPLGYFIEAAHARDIELHAWLNPYRIIHTATNSSDPDTLAPNNPVRLRPELAVGWTSSDGRQGLFLDPGLPEARQLIIDGIEEIIRKYNVDGIHFDDYFYPGSDFDDAASFERYGNGMSLEDWRRENVNTLIRDIQSTVRELNEELDRDVRWGISPTAIWKNQSTNPLGKPGTGGQESFHALYADTRLWVTQELVDYINPQIYWYKGFAIADFVSVFDWWVDLCRNHNVDLYIGHAAWREDENHQPPNWEGEIIRQLQTVADSDYADGSVFFRMQSLWGDLGNRIRDFYRAKDGLQSPGPVITLDTLSIGMPAQNVTLYASADNAPGFNIVGTSVPYKTLYLNGEVVTNRTVEGFFFVFAALESGENVFTFSQEGQADVTRRITRNPPIPGRAPDDPEITVTQINTPVYATVNSNEAWAYSNHYGTGGSGLMLLRGQRDRITGESSNGFVRFSSGIWVRRNAVTLQNESRFTRNPLSEGVYRIGQDYDYLVWHSELFAAVNMVFSGETLRVYFGMHTDVPDLELPNDLSQTIFESVNHGISYGIPFYEFTIRGDARFDGYFVSFQDGEFRVHLKKRKSLSPGDRPLENITIMLDPGHGGSDPGAIGPLGAEVAEKHLVLIHAQKLSERLEALGANVILTRTEDINLSLQERVNMSWNVKPDMFISLHINSVAETVNVENIRGFSVFYRNPNSIELSETFLNFMYYIIPETNRYRGINHANFFVCRPSWTPSVLLEAGFIININDFVWLIDPVMQDKMADATVVAILEYFSE